MYTMGSTDVHHIVAKNYKRKISRNKNHVIVNPIATIIIVTISESPTSPLYTTNPHRTSQGSKPYFTSTTAGHH